MCLFFTRPEDDPVGSRLYPPLVMAVALLLIAEIISGPIADHAKNRPETAQRLGTAETYKIVFIAGSLTLFILGLCLLYTAPDPMTGVEDPIRDRLGSSILTGGMVLLLAGFITGFIADIHKKRRERRQPVSELNEPSLR